MSAEKIASEGFVSADVMAEHLSVTPQTLRKWVKRGLVDSRCYIKIGTTFRFLPTCTIESLQHKSVDDSPQTDEGAPVQLELPFTEDEE